MRVSAIQKDILFVLYQLELRGFLKPIPTTDILTMLNKSRVTVFGTNFRVSCHKLNENGLVHMHRSLQTLRLSFTLTELGRVKAIELNAD